MDLLATLCREMIAGGLCPQAIAHIELKLP